MAAGTLSDTVRSVRAARSAPHAPLTDVAAAVSVPVSDVAAVLAGAGRGRCGRIASDIVSGARRPDAPVSAAAAVASLRVCPPGVLRSIGADRDTALRHAGRGTAAWVGRSKPLQLPAGRVFAESAPAPRDLIVRLAVSDDRAWRRTAATADRCPPAVAAVLAADPSPDVRAAAAANSSAHSGVVGVCSRDDDWLVRCKAAGNVACPPSALTGLIADDYLAVRRAVAKNPASTPDMLARLVDANSDSWEILTAVAERGDCPAATIRFLAQSPIRRVADTASNTLRARTGDQSGD